MNNEIVCVGCGSNDFSSVDQIDAGAVIEGYEKGRLRTKVRHLFATNPSKIVLNKCNVCHLRWFSKCPMGDEAFYQDLQRHDWYYQKEKPEFRFVTPCIEPGDRVLEVGCGSGEFALCLPAGTRYKGLEFNMGAVRSATAKGLDVEKIDLASEVARNPGVYDVVCHFQVLEHVMHPREFMEQCVAALRPGGKLLIAVPSEDSFVGLAESDWLNMPPHHLTRWTDDSLRNIFSQIGLESIEIWHESVAPYHLEWQRKVVIAAGLLKLLGRRPKLVSSRGTYRAVQAALRVDFLSQYLFRQGMKAYPQASHGHSVCAVGVKASG